MKHTPISSRLISVCTLIALLALTLLTTGFSARPASAAGTGAFVTTITIDSGTDVNTSMSETCLTKTPCTLRRAIVQARALPPSQRPILIQFNIPATAGEGYDSTLKIWKLTPLSPSDQFVFRSMEGGQITLDGSTQPGGRTTGPKIIIYGPGTGSKNGLKVAETGASTNSSNVVRGLAFQNFSVHMQVNSDNNIIEDNWFGLNSAGTGPAQRNVHDLAQGTGTGGVSLGAGITGNMIQNNVFLGLNGNAAVIRGEANTFSDNYVGTTADGKVLNKKTDPSLICTPEDWFGGSGLLVDGPDHVIKNNIIAGIRLEISHYSTQPDAIWVESTCDRCVIQNNKIGIDTQNKKVGVCGIGIDITNGEQIQVLNNTFAETYNSAIFLNGALFDANTLRGNIVYRSTPWLLPEGSPKADDAILRFSGLPDPFEFFNPAKVTSIDGTTVTGTAGTSNPCPRCTIELFLDDDDGITEALQSLGVVTANANGNWTATLPAALADGYGIRTTSTTAQYNTIPNMSAGTTAGLSVLYLPEPPAPTGYFTYLPVTRK